MGGAPVASVARRVSRARSGTPAAGRPGRAVARAAAASRYRWGSGEARPAAARVFTGISRT